MKRTLLALLLIPFAAFAAISDWEYTPFISYSGQYPSGIIKQGRNFELLQTLWNKPQSLKSLHNSHFDFSDIDTTLLIRQGMIYDNNNLYYSAIPFIDSIAMNNLRQKALSMAEYIIEDTKPEMQAFISTLERSGHKESAFALVHSLVFDDIIWKHIDVSHENTTICPTDSMTWNGVFYFFRPEKTATYGTNGLGLDDNKYFNFAWGDNSNAFLCTAFVKTNILDAVNCILKGQDLTAEMIQDCQEYGIIDDNNNLKVPVFDGQDPLSKAADSWSKSAAASFSKHFDGKNIMDIIGWTCYPNEAACKVILYHEVLSAIDDTLDKTGIVPIPEVLTSKSPSDKKQAASSAYITTW